MPSTRRSFLKTSLAASATTAALAAGVKASAADKLPVSAHEYYELRAYRLKPGASTALLDGYLSKALIPALNARGLKGVGVFTEVEVDKKAVTSKPKVGTPEAPVAVWVLITHPTLESFASVAADLNTDPTVQKAGAEYLGVPKASPAFERLDTWLLRAFAGFPKMQVPAFAKTPTRIFELRDYESHSEERALSKMAMFNAGEIEVMKSLGMSPVFFGQAIAGPNLPHLRYITCAADLATHLDNWKKFGTAPGWVALKNDPQYKDNTSKNTARFVVPTAYSQI
ncbi:MAG: NIPSNAP family protein [Verrucomicrobia bacterium]|nr:NIPSNAP family protein [Verrucomicrobiota bacterium]